MRRLFLAALCFVLPAFVVPASAASIFGDLTPPPQYQYNYNTFEVRLGAYAHDPQSPEGGSTDINIDFFFPKLGHTSDYWLNMLIPRPHVGATGSFVGKTSVIFAGLAWDFDIYDGLFIEGTFDGAASDGHTGANVPPGFNAVGCNATFHESGSLGYHVTHHWSVLATIEHSSNANLCAQNRGLTNVGGRIAYSF